MTADLRSDTVTRPTPAMMEAMHTAPVGDDVFGDDPTVNRLEKLAAEMFGMDEAVFCPSGTMTNQIGISILTEPFQEIICYKGAHIYRYEGGGLAGNSQLSVRLLEGNRGRISPEEIKSNINNIRDPHQPITSLVALENTIVREAGAVYSLQQIKQVSDFSRNLGLKMHLDGARLFNALTVTGNTPLEVGSYFDTISICLSKGLGAPVGSLLLTSAALVSKARRRRKSLGGGMRQAGFLAAAGIYALEKNIGRLREDHRRASILHELIQRKSWVTSVMPAETNIVIFTLDDKISTEEFLSKLEYHGVRAVAFGPQQVRMVTHLDFKDEHLDHTVSVLNKITF
ncbi:MAG: threonine aldolase [Bacteroidetes bacterium]|nr:threonine aldolase [Bacteroidota bacterium]